MRVSYGIVCYCASHSGPRYLLVQRKDSLCFVDFVRGRYETHDADYIGNLLAGMTAEERELLASKPGFGDLWRRVWGDRGGPRRWYREAEAKFLAVRHPGVADPAVLPACAAEPEWGFPKGGGAACETEVQAALREFREETGYACALVGPRYVDSFLGTDGNRYQHVFFLARVVSRESDAYDSVEIRDVQWFSHQQARLKLRRTAVLAAAHRDASAAQLTSRCLWTVSPTP